MIEIWIPFCCTSNMKTLETQTVVSETEKCNFIFRSVVVKKICLDVLNKL